MSVLLIVESPGKIKKLQSFLGAPFVVKASMGHVRDLPEKGLGVTIENNAVQPVFAVQNRQAKTVAALRKAAGDAQTIYLAMDPDREGEAIAWHIKQVIGLPKVEWQRITFNAITKAAVTAALKNPRAIDENLVAAQMARRVLDRLVGYKVSPLLWRLIGKGTSAGRVQSVALRLVVERERAIRAFIPVDYWSLTAFVYRERQHIFPAGLIELDGRPLEQRIGSREEAERLKKVFAAGQWRIVNVETKMEEKKPYPPFITATLQQSASVALSLSPVKTMSIAQALYERGLITYMRTDSPAISDEALSAARTYIGERYAPEFLPARPVQYRAKGLAQEAHECIRPTAVERIPDELKNEMKEEELRVYRLIWQRFLASQMAPARDKIVTVDIVNGNGLFRSRAMVQLFPGWRILMPTTSNREKDDPEELPDAALLSVLAEFKPGDYVQLDRIETKAHQTKPPPRYTEASLIKTLEKEGIGRPSTYAPILSNIRTRGYVTLTKRLLYATPLGERIVDELLNLFSAFWMELPFTRDMESELDKIAEGVINWHKVIIEFDARLTKLLSGVTNSPQKTKSAGFRTDGKPDSEIETFRRSAAKSPSASASKVRPPRATNQRGRRSKKTESPDVMTPSVTTAAPDKIAPPNQTTQSELRCPHCNSVLVVKQGAFGPFYGCPRFPACRFTQSILDQKEQSLASKYQDVKCPSCGGPMTLKKGRQVHFLACRRYPDCTGIQFLEEYRKKPRRKRGPQNR